MNRIDLSFVVIGLNEGERLRVALAAIFEMLPEGLSCEVIYADSGSRDDSCEIAASFPGVTVLQLSDSRPSAAKARNLGLGVARGEFVQLVDGDSILQPGWVQVAMEHLAVHPDVACVFGHCIEEFPEQSVYMRVCALDWHISPGEHRLCGGNALWRRAVLEAFGFFPVDLRYGEEPDLCYRVRKSGWKIICLDLDMVRHDLAMRTFAQYWQRAENSGKAYWSVSTRYFRNPEKMWFYETIRNFVEPMIWLLLASIGYFLSGFFGAGALLFSFILARALQIAFKVRSRTLTWTTAILYGLHVQCIRLPIAVGQLKAAFLTER